MAPDGNKHLAAVPESELAGRGLLALNSTMLTASLIVAGIVFWQAVGLPLGWRPANLDPPWLRMVAWLAAAGTVNGAGWYWAIATKPMPPSTPAVRVTQRIMALLTLLLFVPAGCLMETRSLTGWPVIGVGGAWLFGAGELLFFAIAPTHGRRWAAACQLFCAVWTLVLCGEGAVFAQYY